MSYKSKSDNKNELHEPMMAYSVQGTAPSFYNLLGSSKSVKLSNDFDIIKLARQGFPKSLLLSLAKKISLNIQELSNILHISERTLQRYDDDAIIKTEYAEKAVELARLYTRGEEVFGSMDKFKIWIKTPGIVFKGEAPVTILDTSAGFDMVFKELGRIEHGIFA
ncbi:antitoxin Xre-like helix-turn-helix domain-containing protein [Mucilaginibacter sp. SP1R1]|uniref:type II RES/Xre toxin-antitoxin system antitoxin n=1 Tax=Mucilaginibacter sp. SP1R1 TaxID=2723091 RepID=UPI00161C93DA|nr:antitoxin Xre-like helix-turn-helix domain-containing protein [Mucilaginibacter sp. SP1R1]MBB6147760.1 putative toxin-antitoxin system antitoxin component (TIGR02293 family) [Mucilaginibacter sp. SP1R1]